MTSALLLPSVSPEAGIDTICSLGFHSLYHLFSMTTPLSPLSVQVPLKWPEEGHCPFQCHLSFILVTLHIPPDSANDFLVLNVASGLHLLALLLGQVICCLDLPIL